MTPLLDSRWRKKKKHLICCKTGIGTDLLRFQVARYDSFLFFFLNKLNTVPLFFLCLSSCSIIHSRVRLFCCTPSPAVSLSLYLYSQERVRSQYVSFSFYFSSPPIVARVPQSCSTKHCDRRMNCKSVWGEIARSFQIF